MLQRTAENAGGRGALLAAKGGDGDERVVLEVGAKFCEGPPSRLGLHFRLCRCGERFARNHENAWG